MNWYKTSQSGEWWIIDGQAIYADGDVGDMNHSGYVMEHVAHEIADMMGYSFDDEFFEWGDIQTRIIENMVNEGELNQKILSDLTTKQFEKIALKNGVTQEQLDAINDRIDPRDYGMQHLGWKRVQGSNVQTFTMSSDDLRNIAQGLDDTLDEDIEGEDTRDPEYTIEVLATRKIYYGVPLSVINKANPMEIVTYGGDYSPYSYSNSNSCSWYKTSQVSQEVINRYTPLINEYLAIHTRLQNKRKPF